MVMFILDVFGVLIDLLKLSALWLLSSVRRLLRSLVSLSNVFVKFAFILLRFLTRVGILNCRLNC